MPWQADGNFLRTNNQFTGAEVWEKDQQAAIKIIASRHDYHDEDLAVGIENCLNLDGYNVMRADLDMGGFSVKNQAIVEGAWTPQLVNPVTGASNSTMAATPNNAGWYIRAGRLVTLFARLEWTATNNQADIGMAINGMPFSIDPAFAGAALGMYATNFLAGLGMAVSGIGSSAVAVQAFPGGESVNTWHPEAVVQGVVPIPAGESYDPNNPANLTFGEYIHLRSYFGTNNDSVNGTGANGAQYPFLYVDIQQAGTFGFQMTYLTNDA